MINFCREKFEQDQKELKQKHLPWTYEIIL